MGTEEITKEGELKAIKHAYITNCIKYV